MLCVQTQTLPYPQPSSVQVHWQQATHTSAVKPGSEDKVAGGKPADENLPGGKSFRITVLLDPAPEKILTDGKSFKVKVPFRSEELKAISSITKKTSITLFIERNFAIDVPFTEISALVRREVSRFGLNAVQLYVDGFVDGPTPYFQMRVEGCRTLPKIRTLFRASFCVGLGALHDPHTGGVFLRAAVSGNAEYLNGRLFSSGFYEQNLMGPPFSYFEHEHGIVLLDFERGKILSSFIGRTQNRVRSKVEISYGRFAFYGIFGSRRLNQSPVTVGTRITF